MAPNVEVIMAAQVLQLFSFGLFMPSMVHMIDEIMERGEAVKGQGWYIMVTTITSIVSAVIGGVVIDFLGVHTLTLLSTVITGAGALMVIFTVDKVKSNR
jgi:PPP family 3-phenylpropionic acid transporter